MIFITTELLVSKLKQELILQLFIVRFTMVRQEGFMFMKMVKVNSLKTRFIPIILRVSGSRAIATQPFAGTRFIMVIKEVFIFSGKDVD